MMAELGEVDSLTIIALQNWMVRKPHERRALCTRVLLSDWFKE
jgi:hypothetical protein